MKRTFLILLLALAAGVAHADSSLGTSLNQFTPPAGDTSVEFMREVFGSIVGMISSGGNLQTGQADGVLGSMMKVFNSAVLFLGMLFVGYTTVKGTVDSAHDGEILGKKMSSIWIPLRTVGGTALLLPLGSGYSLIQIGILWLALQGVGVADAVWKAAIEQINRDNMISRPMIPDSRPLAANILKFEVCAAAMNKQFQDSGRSTRIQPTSANQVLTNTGKYSTTTSLTQSRLLARIRPRRISPTLSTRSPATSGRRMTTATSILSSAVGSRGSSLGKLLQETATPRSSRPRS